MLIKKTLLYCFYISLCLLLCSCLGPKMINKWVNQHYEGNLPNTSKKKEDAVSISHNISFPGSQLSNTENKTSKVLPLIIYWQYDYINTCTLNPVIPINDFTAAVTAYSRTTAFKQKLNGQKLELTVNKIPGRFTIDDKGHLIWLVYAFAWDKITIKNEDRELQVSYRVINGGAEVKSGTVSVTAQDREVPLGMFRSLKKKTKEFLTSYNAGIKTLSKTAMDKILGEL